VIVDSMGRRTFLRGGAALAASGLAAAQTARDWSGANPIRFPDPDLVSLEKGFDKYRISNTPIQRLYTGSMWAEGPAWHSGGQYFLWSDIPADRQMRWLQEDGHVSTFRKPSSYSNGNTFDYQGRQLTCEHLNRRVVRYEHDGSVTVLASSWEGKKLNAPNDIVVAPDGGIWFTDPGYGSLTIYEGTLAKLEIKQAAYRIDPQTGKMDKVLDDLFMPNGLCFSPDYKKLYVCDSGETNYPEAKNLIQVYDVADGRTLRNSRRFTFAAMPGKTGGLADGIRADADGNIWAGVGRGGPGYDGVHVFDPGGVRIGMIVLPEICANVCFGGPKRNRLFMAASQSIYTVYVSTQGAHIC
jgi:gluconolactonase